VGLGWFISADHGDEIVWKSGLTGGYTSNMAFSPVSHRGAIVLSNEHRYDPIGISLALIDSNFRLSGLNRLF